MYFQFCGNHFFPYIQAIQSPSIIQVVLHKIKDEHNLKGAPDPWRSVAKEVKL